MWSKPILGRMANLVTAIVSALLLIANVQNVNTRQPQINLTGYTLVFEDNFDGDRFNAEVWHTHNGNGIRKGGYWSDRQCTVRDGSLVITTEYKADGAYGAGWYTGALDTHGTFEHTYGYYECRCILPAGQGLWSAFWLFNPAAIQVNGTGTLGAELDVFESPFWVLQGKNAWKVTSNIHYNGYDLETKYENVVISALDNDPYKNYNTYGLLWTEDAYIFYVNGYAVGRSDFGGISQKPEYMILSCEVDGTAGTPTVGWSGDIRRNRAGEDFRAEFIVDYVRVYDLPKR